MRSEQEIRQLVHYYVEELEGGHDPFFTEGWEPQDGYCLWCVRLRLLHWILGDLDKPDNGNGTQEGWHLGWARAMNELATYKQALHVKAEETQKHD